MRMHKSFLFKWLSHQRFIYDRKDIDWSLGEGSIEKNGNNKIYQTKWRAIA